MKCREERTGLSFPNMTCLAGLNCHLHKERYVGDNYPNRDCWGGMMLTYVSYSECFQLEI